MCQERLVEDSTFNKQSELDIRGQKVMATIKILQEYDQDFTRINMSQPQ